jgi:DNA polymerase-3 subunit alpha
MPKPTAWPRWCPQPVQGRHIPLKKSIVNDPDLKREYETNEVSKKVIDLAIALEGTVRSHGVHACGVVIAPSELVNYLPLEMAQKGVVAVQFPMGQVEELGCSRWTFWVCQLNHHQKRAAYHQARVYDVDIDLSDIRWTTSQTFDCWAAVIPPACSSLNQRHEALFARAQTHRV